MEGFHTYRVCCPIVVPCRDIARDFHRDIRPTRVRCKLHPHLPLAAVACWHVVSNEVGVGGELLRDVGHEDGLARGAVAGGLGERVRGGREGICANCLFGRAISGGQSVSRIGDS